MAISSDLLQAKQTLSSRLLRASAQEGAAALHRTFIMASAAAVAGRNVHAVGVGRKVVDGRLTDTMAVRMYVAQKIARSAMAPRDYLPASIDGIPTDVVEAPLAYLATSQRKPVAERAGAASADPCTEARQQKQETLIAGVSTSHPKVTAGTLGYFFRSVRIGDDPSAVLVLSNNHIFANLNRASAGDPLYQPGSLDGGTTADAIGTLSRWIPLNLDGVTPNRVDAAVGELNQGRAFDLQICSIGKLTGSNRVIEGMAVRKHGRTSGYVEGVVSDESIDALVAMDHSDPNVLGLFQNQMRLVPTAPFSAIGLGGDSGSLVVEAAAPNAVGLYFANPASGEYGYASHITDVMTELEIDLL